MNETTRIGLQEPENTPQVFSTSAESLNAMSLNTLRNRDGSISGSLVGCGYNSENRASMSGRVFVLGVDGKPLTPCKIAKARKLLNGKVAKPIWNKFSQFGIQLLVDTRKETPKTILGVDFGTKFEGYSLISGKENALNIMLKLPDKKKLVKKIEERRILRRARRWRNCKRRASRFDNRKRNDFIAPSQLQIVNSRLKCMNEFFKSYPINAVALEDVKFNHWGKHYGKNFSTIEIGKKKIFDWIRERVGMGNLIQFSGMDTKAFRENNNLPKSNDKSAKSFYSHCVDSFAIANELSNAKPNENLIYVDDNYRAIRRKLHDAQFSKGRIRYKYSTGNFKSIRKGTMCEYGQIVGGTKEQAWYCDFELQKNGKKICQKGKTLKNIAWLSHHYKSMVIANPKKIIHSGAISKTFFCQ